MELKENKMGVMPVKKLIINMSVPMMLSMLVQALYNIVDSIFVARLSEGALTAVTLAFPLQNLMIAVGTGTGVGVNAYLSRALGEKKFSKSDAAANAAILLAFFSFLVFALIGVFGAGSFISLQTGDPEIRAHGTAYLRIVMILSAGIFFQVTFERLLQSTGRTFYSMVSQMTGAVVNIIFDPILIFGFLGFPKLGVAGAAYATVLGQCVAASIGLAMNLKKNPELHFSISRILHPGAEVIKRIYAVGVPSILMISVGSVMSFFLNLILATFSSTAQAVYGAYFKLQSFFFMPVFGLNNGLIPVLAYNYGARNQGRIREALTFSLKLAVAIMTAGMLAFEIFPAALLSLFHASPEMTAIGVPALRIIGISLPIAGCCIMMGSIFQAFSVSIYSLIVSVGRQLVVLLPAAWLLSRLGDVNLVWLAFPIAEIVSLILSTYFFRRIYQSKVKTL